MGGHQCHQGFVDDVVYQHRRLDEMDSAAGKAFIRDLAAFEVPVLLFSGGEPLIRRDIFDMVEYARGQNLRVGLSTNGTVINDGTADTLKQLGFAEVGIDTENPLELLLAIRRSGARRLERWFGPGEEDTTAISGRRPFVSGENMAGLADAGDACLAALDPVVAGAIREHGFVACVATSDVHEYSKVMVERILGGLDVEVVDGGVSVDPDRLAAAARDCGADFIALSTYAGIALSYLTDLRQEMARIGLDIPVFVGGRLNQIPVGSNTSLPVDVRAELAEAGAHVCRDVPEMLDRLVATPSRRDRAA